MPRVYAPVSSLEVDALLGRGDCQLLMGFSVTNQLRAAFPDEDDEGLEHLATQFAAAGAAGDPVAVAVFDLPDTHVTDGGSDRALPGQIRCLAPAQRRELACVLLGDPGAVVRDDAEMELSWYDAGELPLVRDLLMTR